jgi:hypothetical protein
MITCTMCGTGNPLGTRWCRQCGTKLNLEIGQVQAAMQETDAEAQDQRWIAFGNSALTVGGFLLVAVIVLRVALMPALPAPEPVAALPRALIPETTPPAASVSALAAGNQAVASQRLAWRAVVCRSIANDLGLDLAALDATRGRIADAQDERGIWEGSNRLAATSLAVLALQAWPSDASLGQASRGLTWIKSQVKDPTRLDPLGRTLAFAALADAQELSAGDLQRSGNYCVDGKVPHWQAWLIACLPPGSRPSEAPLVQDACSDLWRWQLTISLGQVPALERQPFFVEAAPRIAAADRPAWVSLAWQCAPAPGDFTKILQEWSRAPVLPAPPELAPAGKAASDALWLIALSAPWRIPALNASP